jgi:hypothetical protein
MTDATTELDDTQPIPVILTPLGTATALAVTYFRQIAVAAGVPWTEGMSDDIAVMVRCIAESASLELIMSAIGAT